MVAKKPWFGERKYGWGFRPITWQGWVSVLVLILAIALDAIYLANTIFFIPALIAAVFIFLILSMLKSETP
jgi:hypothetical protein